MVALSLTTAFVLWLCSAVFGRELLSCRSPCCGQSVTSRDSWGKINPEKYETDLFENNVKEGN